MGVLALLWRMQGVYSLTVDFNRIVEVLAELDEFVRREPRLSVFVPGVAEVRNQAQDLAMGGKKLFPLSTTSKGAIPDRALAERIVEITSRLPAVDAEGEDPDSLRLLAQLNANLFSAIVHAVFFSFPDVIPRQRPTGTS